MTTSKIYCIWYPSGGFGHFINAVLTLHGVNFRRPSKTKYSFSKNGNSHNLELVVPKYFHNPREYSFNFDKDFHYSVLIDNGINDESTDFVKFFSDSCVIKICYDDKTWPVVAYTMIEKAAGKNISQEISPGDEWDNNDVWAIREKYFLFLRDHELRFAWRENTKYNRIDIKDILSYSSFRNCLLSLGIETDCFESLWNNWNESNQKFINPISVAQQVIDNIKNKNYLDISHIKDIWTQAVIYYFIWLEYSFEVPHNTYSNWFTNIENIVTMLTENGVIVD